MTGIVLAGGENRRMGTDKAFLDIAGRPLIEHILQTLHDLFPRIIIVTNSPDRYAAYAVSLVTDAYDKRGPLTGIYSGLRESRDEYNFIVACDMPFLQPRLISFMAGLAEGNDVVVPSFDGFFEPLHAVYRRGILPVVEERIRAGDQRIREMYKSLRVRYITADEIDRFDPGRRSFKNLNTPQEYEEAACAVWECRN
jgi:molybdopterin-guanine dinucleotide biosynthesis protein A